MNINKIGTEIAHQVQNTAIKAAETSVKYPAKVNQGDIIEITKAYKPTGLIARLTGLTKDFEYVQEFFKEAIHASKGNKVSWNPDINENNCWNQLLDRIDDFDRDHNLAIDARLELWKQAAKIIPSEHTFQLYSKNKVLQLGDEAKKGLISRTSESIRNYFGM